MTPQEQLDAFIAENKITLTTKFVPFSLSRNAEEKDKTLNWKVTLSSPNGKITTDYSKGIGHLDYPQTTFLKLTGNQAHGLKEAIDSAAETGVAKKVTLVGNEIKFGFTNTVFPTPKIKEILESLCLDSDVRNYLSFESWANDFGYNPDSRKDEKIYQSCQKTTEGLSKVLGGTGNIEKVQQIIYDIDNEPTPKKVKP